MDFWINPNNLLNYSPSSNPSIIKDTFGHFLQSRGQIVNYSFTRFYRNNFYLNTTSLASETLFQPGHSSSITERGITIIDGNIFTLRVKAEELIIR